MDKSTYDLARDSITKAGLNNEEDIGKAVNAIENFLRMDILRNATIQYDLTVSVSPIGLSIDYGDIKIDFVGNDGHVQIIPTERVRCWKPEEIKFLRMKGTAEGKVEMVSILQPTLKRVEDT